MSKTSNPVPSIEEIKNYRLWFYVWFSLISYWTIIYILSRLLVSIFYINLSFKHQTARILINHLNNDQQKEVLEKLSEKYGKYSFEEKCKFLREIGSEIMSSPWEAISAISSLIQTIVIIITVGFAVLQIRQTNQSHKLDVSIRLFDELSSPSSRKNRAFIYSLKSKELSQLPTEELLIVDEVLSSLDRAWILIENRQIDSKFVYETYGEIFLKIGGVTQPIWLTDKSPEALENS